MMPRMKAAWYHRLDMDYCCFEEDCERSMARSRVVGIVGKHRLIFGILSEQIGK